MRHIETTWKHTLALETMRVYYDTIELALENIEAQQTLGSNNLNQIMNAYLDT